MLIEFRVKNYRSFSEESVLSLVASSGTELAETNLASTELSAAPKLVRSSVIYGANASGKSNLLRAMLMMRGVVLESFSLKPDQLFNIQPFKLDATLVKEPSLFEITILLEGIRYQYGFEITSERIIGEWLLVYQKSKPQKWFDRRYDPLSKQDTYEFSSYLLGQKRAWQKATRSNALFLSTAVQLNSEQLKKLYSWFTDSLVVLLDGGHLANDISTGMVQNANSNEEIRSIIRAADIAISAISAVPKKGFHQQFTFDLLSGSSETIREEREILVPEFTHEGNGITARFEFADESQGTQKLFALAGPLLDIVKNGKVLVIDELDRSFHPLLVRQIVNTFQDNELNVSGAQLIFSTHDTSLLDSDLLRRDQIWFTEKRSDQSSELVPLSEFSPRKGEAIEKGYLSGRYGGIPVLNSRLIAEKIRAEK